MRQCKGVKGLLLIRNEMTTLNSVFSGKVDVVRTSSRSSFVSTFVKLKALQSNGGDTEAIVSGLRRRVVRSGFN